MSKTIMGCAAVSADGYIAYDDGQIGPLFDWMSGGDVEWKWSESDEHAMRSTQASKDFMQSVYTDIGAVIMGRNTFDQTNGWNGVPAAGDRVFVRTYANARHRVSTRANLPATCANRSSRFDSHESTTSTLTTTRKRSRTPQSIEPGLQY
jgi:dihydrofolate reductase